VKSMNVIVHKMICVSIFSWPLFLILYFLTHGNKFTGKNSCPKLGQMNTTVNVKQGLRESIL